MKLSGSNIKEFLIFSQKKVFLIYQETETLKKLFMFQETELSCISGNESPKNLVIFQDVTF